ncbi:MAG: hypothetical protein QM581_08145 [Pseudomonas sp.]
MATLDLWQLLLAVGVVFGVVVPAGLAAWLIRAGTRRSRIAQMTRERA